MLVPRTRVAEEGLLPARGAEEGLLPGLLPVSPEILLRESTEMDSPGMQRLSGPSHRISEVWGRLTLLSVLLIPSLCWIQA